MRIIHISLLAIGSRVPHGFSFLVTVFFLQFPIGLGYIKKLQYIVEFHSPMVYFLSGIYTDYMYWMVLPGQTYTLFEQTQLTPFAITSCHPISEFVKKNTEGVVL